MTTFQVRYRSRVLDIDTDKLIRRANVYWLAVEMRGTVRMVEYVRIPFISDYEYGCAEPPPMCIYPMPAMYPREVFLAAANYLLHRATMQVDVRVAVAEGQVGLAA